MEPIQAFDRERFLRDFETLVNIDSSSDNKEGINRVAEFFETRLNAAGFDSKILLLGREQIPCLISEHKKKAGPFDLLFLGHMDTVFPEGEAIKRPFSVQDGRAYGPGVCDMKGGLLVALYTIESLKIRGTLDLLNICVAFNGDEETGSDTSRDRIMEAARNSVQTFVFEPCRPGYRFVLRRKGAGWFTVTVRGQKAHAGADPEKGINAVVELAHQITRIHELNQNEKGTTVQVTVCQGGSKVNVIPDSAQALVDVRIASSAEKERVESVLYSLGNKPFLEGAKITMDGHINRPPMEPGKAAEQLWHLVREQGQKMELTLEAISTGGCSDGNYTSGAGCPTLDGMGIVGANAHREDEYADLASFPVMVELITRACEAIAGKAAEDSKGISGL